MEPEAALRQLGGVAATAALLDLTTRRELRTALAHGRIRQLARGRYGLNDLPHHRRTAAACSAVVSHLSAARHHEWPVKEVPDRVWVTVPRNRKVSREVQADVVLTYADLDESEHADGVTTPLRTVLDCARRLPFDEALAVADSALRAGAVTSRELREAAATLHGPGSRAVRRVAAHADARAANPFESVLRALVIESGLLDVVPQVPVATRTMTFHPDLVDEGRRVVIEADSWSWHRDQQTHGRDCVRHTALALAGWLVLRFTWEQVMRSPAYVRAVLAELGPREHPAA